MKEDVDWEGVLRRAKQIGDIWPSDSDAMIALLEAAIYWGKCRRGWQMAARNRQMIMEDAVVEMAAAEASLMSVLSGKVS